ncbi:2-octaprenyl-6-methoxyphenyl hydroxylase [Pseudoluteimonas lycopersici]|uniref:2-octaprenyl-6-methoxyphenyl hydroxylase n=1 Tax=Pseudoluteimonas lycopersici TaxID=1324796 RepID=A0A516V7W6_9GAMM|nr:2-octaprenyl-6-methoxyphenyl hydroxylase [Lysobacter lycopersici]QDQ74626.1 2-octaprenyl-6-methoxyphenyl hydroxylase [Lysobacter lycopersici]
MPPHDLANSGHHDVVIVGGGLVGASLALALERSGLDVVMVEATPAARLPEVFDQRNLSLAEASVNALDALGVLPALRAPSGEIRRIHVSRNGDFGRVLLRAGDYGREAFGRVVVARDLGDALETRLQALPNLQRYRPARFLGLGESDPGWRRIRISDESGERMLSTRLLVAADGADSAVRNALGIGAQRHDYGQRLFVARLRSERAPDGTAYERFGEHGPTALLPRGDRHYGLVHAVAEDEAGEVAALDDAAFLARVQRAFGWRAGRFLEVGPRSAYPAQRIVADALHAPRVVLVGNAAQSLHPVGAQGFNLGLRDALTLAEMLEAEGIEAAGDGLLERYAARRREDRERTLAFSDGLARFTSNEDLSALRAFGWFAVDRSPSLQARLVGGAMGYRGDVPELCRGRA